MVKPRKPLGGYIRVSRQGSRDEDKFKSPDFQRDALSGWSEREAIPVEFYAPEIDVSGSKSSRPVLDSILADIDAGKLDGIVIYNLSRLARMKPKDAYDLLERCPIVRSVQEDFDTTTPQGRYMRDNLLRMYRMQWEIYQEQFAHSVGAAIAEGIPVRKTIPAGYAQGPDRKLVIDPLTAPYVQEAFRMRAVGRGPKEIGAYLREHLGGSWGKNSVRYTLRNRIYVGELHNGTHENLDAHPPLIDLETFNAAQRSLASSTRDPDKESPWLLNGMLRCEHCRYTLSGTKQSRGRKPIYRCVNQGCDHKARVGAEDIEHIVTEALWATYDVKVSTHQDSDTEGPQEAFLRASEALERWEAREEQGDEDWERRWETLRDRKREARKAINDAQEPGFEGDLRELWPEMSVGERRQALRLVFDFATVSRDGSYRIYRRGEFTGELPMRGKKAQSFPPFPR